MMKKTDSLPNLIGKHKNLSLGIITFENLQKQQIPWLKEKLQQAHIAEWMHGAGLQSCLDRIDGYHENSCEDQLWIASLSEKPFAYLISSRADKQEKFWKDIQFGQGEARTLDVFILDPELLGQGLGTRMIRQFIQELPAVVTDILIDPEKTNTRAVRVYEKVGFRDCFEFIAPWHPVPHRQMHLKRPNPR